MENFESLVSRGERGGGVGGEAGDDFRDLLLIARR